MSSTSPAAGSLAPTSAPNDSRACPTHWSTMKPPFEKKGYCWSHCFKVKEGHNSSAGTLRKVGHQAGTAHTNMMGGSTFNVPYPTALTT